jgi:hypothetical protein
MVQAASWRLAYVAAGTVVTLLSHYCYTDGTHVLALLLHCFYTVFTLMLHCFYTVVT